MTFHQLIEMSCLITYGQLILGGKVVRGFGGGIDG